MATLFTRADLEALPEDGRPHELLDGTFFVTPTPGYGHQGVVMRLGVRLFQAVTNGIRGTQRAVRRSAV